MQQRLTLDFFRRNRHYTSVVAPLKGWSVPFSASWTSRIIQDDLDPDFVESLSIAIPWVYRALYDDLAANPSLSDFCREDFFHRQRGDRVAGALSRVAHQHGVPFEYRRLSCNGQNKLLIKSGRVVLIQEAVKFFDDRPQIADYKKELADLHGFVRQLELDLGDLPLRIRDWTGCIFAVLLHGAAGPKFTREQKSLGNMMLAVPDADYQQWIHRFDLKEIALFGRKLATDDNAKFSYGNQADNVIVQPKKKNSVRNDFLQ